MEKSTGGATMMEWQGAISWALLISTAYIVAVVSTMAAVGVWIRRMM
jgi:hypothetical protein